MEIYKIPKVETRVWILLDDGRTLEGCLFTAAIGPGGGPETVLDRLNDRSEDFLPLAADGDRFLINKSGIISVQVPGGEGVIGAEEAEAAREVPVRISLIGGMSLLGRFVITMPAERARVLDYLNAAPRFVPLLGEGMTTLVQKRFVVTVRSAVAGE
jgi:hypothetical protein